MKVKVKMYVGGTTFDEIVIVDNFHDATVVAKARNPCARVIGKTVIMN